MPDVIRDIGCVEAYLYPPWIPSRFVCGCQRHVHFKDTVQELSQ